MLANLLGCSVPSLCHTTQCRLNWGGPGQGCLSVCGHFYLIMFGMFRSPGWFSGPRCTNSLPTSAAGCGSRWQPCNDGSNLHESDGNCQGSCDVDASTNHAADAWSIREWSNVCPGSIWKYARKHFNPGAAGNHPSTVWRYAGEVYFNQGLSSVTAFSVRKWTETSYRVYLKLEVQGSFFSLLEAATINKWGKYWSLS